MELLKKQLKTLIMNCCWFLNNTVYIYSIISCALFIQYYDTNKTKNGTKISLLGYKKHDPNV